MNSTSYNIIEDIITIIIIIIIINVIIIITIIKSFGLSTVTKKIGNILL